MKTPSLKLIATSIALALSSVAAHAVLERVGPINPARSVGSFPAWYQDTTGVTLEFCDPKNQAEVDGGWCLLLPADAPVVPEIFPANYFDEHFYFSAGASLITPGGTAILDLAQEAVAPNVPAPGGEIVFSRIRVKLTAVPVSGTYRFIHPYGEEVLEGVAGGRIFFTDDVGISCPPGQFDCALGSRLGPFLLPANTPGGPELAPVPGPVPGKLYIADPARVGPVTGSALPDFIDSTGQPRNHNLFRLEGPAGSNLGGPGIDFVETTNLSLMGRVFTGVMPGRVEVNRASYTRNGIGNTVDVFATAFPTTRGRLPAQAAPVAVAPQLAFFPAPCVGVVDVDGTVHPPYSAPLDAIATPLLTDGQAYWAQTQPASIPTGVCVQDLSATDAVGNPVPVFVPHAVTDEVTISLVAYDPSTLNLTIAASSSDETVPPTLSATFSGFRGELVNGQLSLPGITVPPPSLKVQSSALGISQLAVDTNPPVVVPPPPVILPVNGVPTAVDDNVAALVNRPIGIPVLANDIDPDGAADLVAAVNVTQPVPAGATTSVVGGVVSFSPSAAGTYTFTYQAQDAALATSANTGTVTVAVAATQSLKIAAANYLLLQNRLVALGTVSPVAQQTIRLFYINSAGAVLGVAGQTTPDATGVWAVNVAGAPLPPVGTARVRAVSSYGGGVGGQLKIN